MYKHESCRRPRWPRRSDSREPSAKRHQPLAVRTPTAVLRAKRHQPLAVRTPTAVLSLAQGPKYPAWLSLPGTRNAYGRAQPPTYPPPRPPPRPQPPTYPPYTPAVTPGFWFGHTHQLDVKGAAVAGRWIHAKHQVWQAGHGQDPCQNFFMKEAISVGSGSKHGMKI